MPSLSSRDSTTQGLLADLDGTLRESGEGPAKYFSELSSQAIIVATHGSSVAGFLSFKVNYESDELADWSPCIYVSTVCVTTVMRNQGIARMMYRCLIEEFQNL